MREESTVLNFVYLNLGLATLDSTVDLSNGVNLLFGACNLLFPACLGYGGHDSDGNYDCREET